MTELSVMTQFGQFYEAIVDDEVLAALPAMVARHVGTRSVTIQAFAPDWSLLSLTYCYFTEEMADYYRARDLQLHDLWSAALAPTANLGAQIGDELVAEDSYRNSVFYNEFFRHFGDDTGKFVGFGAAIGDRLLTLGAHRPFRAKPFEEADRQRMQELVPHLRRIYAARFALDAATLQAGIADGIANAFAVPAIVVNRQGRLIHANQKGFELVNGGDGIWLAPGGVLVADRHNTTRALRKLIADACAGTPTNGGAMRIERPSGKQALRFSVLPCPGQAGHAVVLCDDPDRATHLPSAILESLFGLTHAEAEVAILLGEGMTPTMIAEAREVSTATVRVQVQQCLRKTETSRQGELIRLINRLPGRMG
jgi:DNA-binding CsgD family transcriptional regulator